MTYRFLEHTADAMVEVRAESFEKLLESAGAALYALALGERRDDTACTREIRVEAEAQDALLVRWLQELIFLLDVERFVATRFRFASVGQGEVCCVADGYTCEPSERAKEVKSATYHDMELREEGGTLVAVVVFDL